MNILHLMITICVRLVLRLIFNSTAFNSNGRDSKLYGLFMRRSTFDTLPFTHNFFISVVFSSKGLKSMNELTLPNNVTAVVVVRQPSTACYHVLIVYNYRNNNLNASVT